MDVTTNCCFNGCTNLAMPDCTKCTFHRSRVCCSFENCFNQVYARGLCVRHGGKKQCLADNCETNARTGGYCSRHAIVGLKKQCIEEGCVNLAHANQRCVRHGGGRKCKFAGCTSLARIAGYCQRHSKQILNDAPAIDPDLLVLLQAEDWFDSDSSSNTSSLEALDHAILDCVLQNTTDGSSSMSWGRDESLVCSQ
ncbi:hypothetical protein SPRG_15972 [Saprolegnia parasitica CBS 223.65]|uniref:Uncharacterized protein n=1 Tax=Saprolegnia parasitica (strain CBS 223.65) TaxID=695850 RepID=A0A067BVL0_SAPPC|nr:hypothetical protein SPRG_15972 [Saprolegnia parasitica CBS 223.65]KDO18637.1 hypothetical protein SPRG_15972 [Saprolegnia parasitica CBS 223.65]|eukprot:XP_012210660.1 hypothetical protein SPRG_15972 [Saprolegnia parasitica CBS 223.65]